MPVNADKPHLWKADVAMSVDYDNDWFLTFAPVTYRETRAQATQQIELALERMTKLIVNDVATIEKKRLEAQAALDAQKTKLERNRLGQFATPPALTPVILRYAGSLLASGE